MPRNIEIKARIESVAAVAKKAAAISSDGPIEILQDDTFFHCKAGRLKLRSFVDGSGQLIFYRRENQQGPKESFYHLAPTTSPDTLRQVLSLACGQIGRVKKHRTLFIIGRTRVHLDRVEHLGEFLELEVVLEDSEATDIGMREADDLMKQFGVLPTDLIEGAYLDLMQKTSNSSFVPSVPGEPVCAH